MDNIYKHFEKANSNIGYILCDKLLSIRFYSEIVKKWFGPTIQKGEKLPQFLSSMEPLFFFYHNGSEYIGLSFEISSGISLIILCKASFFQRMFPEKMFYKMYYDELKSILDCVTEGIYITDGEGNTIMLNKEAEKSWSLPMEDLLGKNMKEIYSNLYKHLTPDEIEQNSVCLRVISTKKEVSMIQSGRNEKFKILVTGTPYFKGDKITKVISTERNLTELLELRKRLEEQSEVTSKYEAELEYYRSIHMRNEDIIFKDKKTKILLNLAYKVSQQDITVLLQGESGVGKELITRYIHNNSSRKNGPLIEINCAAIPENLLESELFGYEKGAFTGASKSGKIGFFELANKGTLFLDEINELPLNLQSKILRSVQEKEIIRVGGHTKIPIDVRFISAANKDLKEAVDKKLFREDLYYRLNVIKIFVPPLRDRKDDIQALVPYFLKKYNEKNRTKIGLSSDALSLLYSYTWPGNVRELSNVIEAAYATCVGNLITSSQLTEIFPDMKIGKNISGTNRQSLKSEVEYFEKQILISRLSLHNSAQSFADALRIDKSTLLRKMKRYGINNPYYRK